MLSLIYFIYQIIWFFGLPIAILYLYLRGARDRMYKETIQERFGKYEISLKECVWIHAVSLGEVRSAEPLVMRLIANNEKIVMTHITPAGKIAASNLFKNQIQNGLVFSVFAPLDYGKYIKRFIRNFNPKYTLIMEIEFWPSIIQVHNKKKIPLLLCNGQYTHHSFTRNQKKFFSAHPFLKNFHAVMVKSETHAKRFQKAGVINTSITGELRFDQSIPKKFIKASNKTLENKNKNLSVVLFSSVVYDEEDLFISLIDKILNTFNPDDCPTFIIVPRAPERFDIVANKLALKGIKFLRRSQSLDSNLNGELFGTHNVILGDSLGEMYFYTNLADVVIIGGGFGRLGSHGISEPLSLLKPTIIGENDSIISYISEDAIKYGVVQRMNLTELRDFLLRKEYIFTSMHNIQDYIAKNKGATVRTLAAINKFVGTNYEL